MEGEDGSQKEVMKRKLRKGQCQKSLGMPLSRNRRFGFLKLFLEEVLATVLLYTPDDKRKTIAGSRSSAVPAVTRASSEQQSADGKYPTCKQSKLAGKKAAKAQRTFESKDSHTCEANVDAEFCITDSSKCLMDMPSSGDSAQKARNEVNETKNGEPTCEASRRSARRNGWSRAVMWRSRSRVSRTCGEMSVAPAEEGKSQP